MTTIAITGGRVVPIEGEPIEKGTVLLAGRKIAAVGGTDLAVPLDAEIVDASGKWVLPGLIDAHVHLGTCEEAGDSAGDDAGPVRAHVRALDAINPADIGFRDAIAGGVLNVNVNPDSGTPVGGQTAAVRCWGRTVDDMALRSPSGLKSTPTTRLGTAAVIRSALVEAANYLSDSERSKAAPRDLKHEALGRVLRKEIPWRQHCHRADDIATALRLAEEFGYELVIDHGTEAHLLADKLAAAGVPVLVGPLMTARSRPELRHLSLASPGRLAAAGVEISIITDHPAVPVQHLIHQAALSVKEGLDPVTALRAVTINPARVIGVSGRLGSLTPGKDADVVLWSGDPLDMMSRAEVAYQGGRQIYRYDHSSREGVFAEP